MYRGRNGRSPLWLVFVLPVCIALAIAGLPAHAGIASAQSSARASIGDRVDVDVDSQPELLQSLEFGDAPEGALAYPGLGTIGAFPTCMNVPVAGWVQHTNFGAWLGPQFDFEPEGNAGLCPLFTPNAYDSDECFMDGDAGLLAPSAFTIAGPAGSEVVAPCPNVMPPPLLLGNICQAAAWGQNLDIELHNHMPSATTGYLNILMDWNQDGRWAGASTCRSGTAVPEHMLANLPVPNPFDGPLSALLPEDATFTVGPQSGCVWSRFSITEAPVALGWDGSGAFEDGETEDYLLCIGPGELDFGDAPDPFYPTLVASNGARHLILPGFMLGALEDPEADGQPDPNALGDDNNNQDDEDGVVFTSPLTPGQIATIDVTTTAGGFLDAWIDFGTDGSWAELGDQIFSSQGLAAGLNSLSFAVLASAPPGATTFARFRLSLLGGLSFDGMAWDGEVEDYQVQIEPLVQQPSVAIAKTLLLPADGMAVISDTVRFQITISNTGNTVISTLPLYDYYSPACLESPITAPPADGPKTDATLGILHWADLTTWFGDLLPGQVITMPVDFHANISDAMYWKEGGWLDYAPKGLPDFGQIQDNWGGPDQFGQWKWTYCGPVASANSLWWFDSKFEPNPVSPPAVNDGYGLAPSYGSWDDHDAQNVQPFVQTLAGLMQTSPVTGTNVFKLEAGIRQHLLNQGLADDYTVTLQPRPAFEWLEDEVRRSEDVILLLGFWQETAPGWFERSGGHYVTVAGVDSLQRTLAFSDPYRDWAELGFPGRILPNPHWHPPSGIDEVHNDAQYASHDVYPVVEESPSPGGQLGLPTYAPDSTYLIPFVNQNEGAFANSAFSSIPLSPIYTEVEYAVAVSPITPTVTCDPTTNLAVVSGATDDQGQEAPEAEAYARVRVVEGAPAVTVAKTMLSPDNRSVLYVGEQVTFQMVVQNTGSTTLVYAPLADEFDSQCLTYSAKSANPDESSYSNNTDPGTVDWFDLTLSNGIDLAPGQRFTVTLPFDVTGVSDDGFNTARVAGAYDTHGQVAATVSDAVTFTCAQPASISGLVWKDVDGDQAPQVGEPGYASVVVSLTQPSLSAPLPSTSVDLFGLALAPTATVTDTTDANGNYAFSNLQPGVYLVTVDRNTLPPGLLLTSDDDPLTVTVAAGQAVTNANFGFAEPVTIGDYLFLDNVVVNGVPDPGENVGVNNVLVILTDTVRSLVYTQLTVGNGDYLFSNLTPSTYTIAVDYPSWLVMTTTPHPQTFQIDSGQSDLNRDFGFTVTTGVAMQSLTAQRVRNRTVVAWVTAMEVNNEGFHVWRSERASGPYVRLTGQLIPSTAPVGGGASYSYVDGPLPPNQFYWYRIEAAPSGEFFGPVTDNPSLRPRLFLPVLLHTG